MKTTHFNLAYMPNGLTSYLETFYEFTVGIENILNADNQNVITELHEKEGSGGMYEIAQALTTLFEFRFQGEVWGEEGYRDWHDTLDEFWAEIMSQKDLDVWLLSQNKKHIPAKVKISITDEFLQENDYISARLWQRSDVQEIADYDGYYLSEDAMDKLMKYLCDNYQTDGVNWDIISNEIPNFGIHMEKHLIEKKNAFVLKYLGAGSPPNFSDGSFGEFLDGDIDAYVEEDGKILEPSEIRAIGIAILDEWCQFKGI